MKKKKYLDIALPIIIILFLLSLILFMLKQIETYKVKQEIKESIIEKVETNISVEEQINNLKTTYNNPEVIGIITIDEEINTPVVQTDNNKYYLYNSLSKERSVIGATFIDSRHNINTSKQINVYGHNSGNYNPPFRTLQKYLNEDYYKTHPIIELKVNNETRTYEIFSVAIVDKTSKVEHMQFNYTTDDEWLEHFNRLKAISLYNNNLVLEKQDKIIILQTCLFGTNNGRFLIISGKQIQI